MSSQSYLFNPTERTLAAAGDGFSAPRLTTTDRLALSLGVNGKGMMVYDTTLTTLCLWNGTAWEFVNDNSNGWVSVTDFGAKGDGVTDDTAAIQAAINAVGQNGALLYPQGNYRIASTVTLIPQQHHYGLNAIITVDNGVTAFSRSTNGFPGRIRFTDFTFQGTAGTGKAISITNNTPFVTIENCRFLSFSEAVRLTDSYCSEVKNCNFTSNGIGLTLTDACHVTSIIDCFFDANTTAGVCINGTPSGAIGTNPMHNIALISVSLQNSPYGLWAEKVYDLNLRNIYHEGNTTVDLQLGVADAGAYNRYCNSFIVDGWQSSSGCAGGTNIRIQHAVGGILKGLAFNVGTSAVNAVLTADGFCDKLSVDYYLVQTAAPSSTVPFTFTAPADVRVVTSNVGRMIIPKGLQAINFGNLGSTPEKLYSGFIPVSGRPCVILESLGSNQDMMFKVTDLERHYDAANNLRFTIDHLNQRVETAYTFRPTTDGVLNLGGPSNKWDTVYAATGAINTSDQNAKDFIEPIPQSWIDAWGDVQYVRFKYKDAIAIKGSGARWHVGVIAQKIKEAFEKRGIDAFEIGLLCYDKWEQEVDVDGNVHPAGERYGVRYEECLALECAYLRSKLNP